ncbi:DUF5617 domain-containing protein [Legionella dresdenensis]
MPAPTQPYQPKKAVKALVIGDTQCSSQLLAMLNQKSGQRKGKGYLNTGIGAKQIGNEDGGTQYTFRPQAPELDEHEATRAQNVLDDRLEKRGKVKVDEKELQKQKTVDAELPLIHVFDATQPDSSKRMLNTHMGKDEAGADVLIYVVDLSNDEFKTNEEMAIARIQSDIRTRLSNMKDSVRLVLVGATPEKGVVDQTFNFFGRAIDWVTNTEQKTTPEERRLRTLEYEFQQRMTEHYAKGFVINLDDSKADKQADAILSHLFAQVPHVHQDQLFQTRKQEQEKLQVKNPQQNQTVTSPVQVPADYFSIEIVESEQARTQRLRAEAEARARAEAEAQAPVQAPVPAQAPVAANVRVRNPGFKGYAAYEKIWKQPEMPSANTQLLDQFDCVSARCILQDYASKANIFFFHAGRNHAQLIKDFLKNNKNETDPVELLKALQKVLEESAHTGINPKGSLARRLDFIEAKIGTKDNPALKIINHEAINTRLGERAIARAEAAQNRQGDTAPR